MLFYQSLHKRKLLDRESLYSSVIYTVYIKYVCGESILENQPFKINKMKQILPIKSLTEGVTNNIHLILQNI